MGEKPLYYGWMGDTLLFGSELKALRTHPAWRGEVDREALTLFLRYGYIPAPRSIYQGIQKALPGTILRFRAGASRVEPETTVYWSAREAAETGMAAADGRSESELVDELESRLGEAVRREMVADVPLGAFLSGGIDSSLIVALMQAHSDRPVRTFTIGFEEPEYNEAPHANAVARHLGTDHTELFVHPAEALAVVPRLPTLYDEPFADSSQGPTLLVCELARQHVTVSLSGDGGDELFGGYDRYFLGLRAWSFIRPIPRFLRRAVGRGVRALPPQRWDAMLRGVGLSGAAGAGRRVTGDRLHKLAGILSAETWEILYRGFVSQWRDAPSVVVDGREPATAFTDTRPWSPTPDPLSRMTFLDQVTYLPDDILVKVDRASMGVSLESRAPFLDHHVVELAWRIPSRWKVHQGRGKWLLRRLLDRYVPRELIERPKMGFGLPIDHWLRGPLKDWAAELLDESRLRREGFLDPQSIGTKWREHQNGSRNWHYLLWVVLMFQAWLEAQTA
jgi:asparagine synthase (glutamine-hydrolysing)